VVRSSRICAKNVSCSVSVVRGVGGIIVWVRDVGGLALSDFLYAACAELLNFYVIHPQCLWISLFVSGVDNRKCLRGV